MRDSVRNQVTARGWFRKVPSAAGTSNFGLAVIAIAVFAVLAVGFWIAWAGTLPKELLLLIPLVPIIITVAVIRAKLKRGQRTAEGRAICDQVEGFRTYLATAEADQLKFEEGEDIFSKYLPGRSSSNWPTAGRRSAATWSPWAGCRTRHRTGTSATIRWRRSTPHS